MIAIFYFAEGYFWYPYSGTAELCFYIEIDTYHFVKIYHLLFYMTIEY